MFPAKAEAATEGAEVKTMVSNNALPRALRRSLELVLVVGAARRERLLGATEGLVDILLEIILKKGEGPARHGRPLPWDIDCAGPPL